ncbi:hypothetical protein [Endozoicomonas numazuensis]|uniref:Uncharacterized protein n=1 Tax=Endozoicomonas numazuensis TaxID=1137799 RepID=A0A081NDE9_9GAMM|nr:hypothetical protein [Endozoicomonas numazuensis]KEQ16472.1 hypothetical protein GZ78_21685 [Endozoicomonas numazuensis]
MPNITDLRVQLEKTIKALESKQKASGERIFGQYLESYRDTLLAIDSGAPQSEVNRLANKLLNCARGYMETSSNYQQGFLNEMGKTEKIVKNL